MILTTAPTVLLCDEQRFASLLKHIIEHEGFQGIIADKLDEVVSLAESKRPDLITLNGCWMLDAAVATREKLHNNSRTHNIPVTVLLTNSADAEPFEVHQFRPTEYLFGPFSPDQFIATLRRSYRSSLESATNVHSFAGILMNVDAHRVYRDGRIVDLGPIEYRLLRHFITYPRKVFSRSELLEAVWGNNIHVQPRTVDVHVSNLRKALSTRGEPNYLRTVRGAGYSLDSEAVLVTTASSLRLSAATRD
ncbi:winged helix-turn-helix domain-containing protein [Sinorhizobium meliloti]|uniref:winged helix-turn-helix domain-containing protein n=1 Tax=Rhizobium meliloti TaxID=382 RepID=UPI000696B9E4|nr:winged helix-turn-helix domain-containing protein [Sinorhizobium meliloti]